jgi:putative endonuclease
MRLGLPQGRGQEAESLACDYLEARGLNLLARNFRCKLGELDLIMHDGETLVFIEVKFRNKTHYGHGSEAVDRSKQGKLVRTAQVFLQQHPEYTNSPMRFDVISIEGPRRRVQWLANAFDAE